MKPSFWKTLETLGASGAAAISWRHQLGDDWPACRRLLHASGTEARTVLLPHCPQHLDLMPEGERDFVAMTDDGSHPPIMVSAEEAAELRPCWPSLAKSLGEAFKFTALPWDDAGWIRQIGTAHNAAGLMTPVLLFLPSGCFGDSDHLIRGLHARGRSLVLLPSCAWLTPGLDALRRSMGHEFVGLAERLALPTVPTARVLPALIPEQAGASGKRKALILPAPGLSWANVTITIRSGRTLMFTAPGQEGTHTFKSRSKMGELHPLGILMTLASTGQWTNPPRKSQDYENASRAFRRLRELLGELVALPGQPFRKSGDAYLPEFRIALGRSLSRTADRAMSKADPHAADIAEVRRQVDRFTLACRAMWELLRDRSGLTEQDLEAKIPEIDSRAGRIDGRMTRQPAECSACG